MNLADILEASADKVPDKTAVICEEQEITYAQLLADVNRLGNALRSLHIHEGDHVGIMLPNCKEFLTAYYGILKIGAVAITLNVMSTPYELEYYLASAEAKGIIIDQAFVERFKAISDKLPQCHTIIVRGEHGRDLSFEHLLVQHSPVLVSSHTRGDSPAVIIYSSGTTGRPKGIILSHNNLFTNADAMNQCLKIDSEDRCLMALPLYHSYGATNGMNSMIKYGGSLFIMERFEAETTMKAIEDYKITWMPGVPTMFMAMLYHSRADQYDLSSLRKCNSGGASIPLEILEKFKQKFHVELVEGYGLTEASPVVCSYRVGMPVKAGSVGLPIPGVEVKIFDENDQEVAIGKVGELVVRGPNVMLGYINDEEETNRALRNGWLHTGDLAKQDEDGYIYIVDRKKDLIITAGYNVYPREVEEVLYRHKAVAEAVVIGVPNTLKGEVAKALIVPKKGVELTEEEIEKFCREHLSAYKVPRIIEFRKELPKSPTGKIIKKLIR